MIEVIRLVAAKTATSGVKMNAELQKVKKLYKTKTNEVNVICVKLEPLNKLMTRVTLNVYLTEK